MAEETPGQWVWELPDDELIDELSRPVHPDDRDGYLVLRVAVSRILKRLVTPDNKDSIR